MATKATFDADFSKFLGELNKVEVKLRDFEPAADKASAKLERVANSLNGNKLAEQAGLAVAAISKIDGGVGALNKGELTRYGALIDAATEKFNRMGREVPAQMAAVKASLDAARAPAEALQTSGSRLSELFTQGLGLGAGLGVMNLAQSALGAIKDQISAAFTEGQKLSQLGNAFQALQGGAAPANRALDDLRVATRGLVSDIDLMAAANKASLLGLNDMGIQTDRLASVAVKLGKAMGQDAAKSVDDLTTALARQSPMILDNLGIKVSLTDATEAFARRLGKSSDALTDEEKKLAFASAAMEAAEAKAATLGESQLTLGEQLSRVSNILTNTRAELGSTANDSGILAGAVGTLADRLDETIGSVREAWDAFKDASSGITDLISSVNGLGISFEGIDRPLRLVFLPALGWLNEAANLAANGLDRLRAFREWMGGTLGNVDLPAPPGSQQDRQLGGTFGQGERARAELKRQEEERRREYEKQQEQALRAIEQGERKLEQARDKARAEALRKEAEHQKRLAALTGADKVSAAKVLAGDVLELKGRVTAEQAAKGLAQLYDARTIAQAIQPGAVKGLTDAMNALATHPGVAAATRAASAKVFGKLANPEDLKRILQGGFRDVQLGELYGAALGSGVSSIVPDTYALRKGLEGVGVPLTTINDRFARVMKATRDWRTDLQNVTTAFANLSQISGGTLDGLTRQLGSVFGAADAGRSVVEQLGKLFKSDKFATSTGGRALAGGLSGLAAGAQIAELFGGNRWGALAGGAGAGAASGYMAGGWAGAGVGAITGGFSAYMAAQKEEEQRRNLMRTNREQLLAQFDGREDLIEQARRVGISEHTVNRWLLQNTTDTEMYASVVNDLNAGLQREKTQADALSRSLGDVAKVNGVLSRQQFQDMRSALVTKLPSETPGGGRARNPGAAITPDTRDETIRGGPRSEAVDAFLRQQTQSLLTGLSGALNAGAPMSQALVASIGESLPAAFAELRREGVSTVDALRQLEPVMSAFQEKAVLAGYGSSPGFDALNASLGILKDKTLGPLVEQASFASQAMAALQNTGYLTQETFSGFAGSITDAFASISGAKGADQALRLLQQPLQNVWQLSQDFGYEVDAATSALLEQAEAAGLVGDRFRPAAERMVDGLGDVVERLDDLIAIFKGDLVTESEAGARSAGGAILDAFANVRPRVRVEYEYPEPGAPPGPPASTTPPNAPRERFPSGSGMTAAQAATQGGGVGDVYLDGERVGYAVARQLGNVADLIGA